MTKLLDFVFDNIGLFIFLAALVMPLLAKVRKTIGQEGERPVNRMPSFGGKPGSLEELNKEEERKRTIRAAQRRYEEDQLRSKREEQDRERFVSTDRREENEFVSVGHQPNAPRASSGLPIRKGERIFRRCRSFRSPDESRERDRPGHRMVGDFKSAASKAAL